MINPYFKPSQPGSFSGKSTFIKTQKLHGKNIDVNDLNKILINSEAYTMHFPAKRHFKRRQIIVKGIDDTWQADLVDLNNIKHINNDSRYILTIIDVFSKYAWGIPIQDKKAKTITNAFENIFIKFKRIPKRIHTDKGGEFINYSLKNIAKKYKFKIFALDSEMKASIIERFNRTLKQKMYRFFTHTANYRYIDILDDLINSYNKTYHSSIKTAPELVNKENESEIWSRLYQFPPELFAIKFKIGDKVRISKEKSHFEKGYTAKWTREHFLIHNVLPTSPPVYKIIDLLGNPIKGSFYSQQLQIIDDKDTFYKVEKILKKKKIRGKEQYLIKWLGYPDIHNSWEPASSFANIETDGTLSQKGLIKLINLDRDESDRLQFSDI